MRRLHALFADLLAYPRAHPVDVARAAAAQLAPWSPGAAACMTEFATLVAPMDLGRVQEVYTDTFDLGTSRCPYVGYHLFGESYKRSVFLIRLQADLADRGVDRGGELPDHLAPLLRLLATGGDAERDADLVADALLPALRKMTGPRGADEAPPEPDRGPEALSELGLYERVLRALQLLLEQHPAARQGDASTALPAPSGAR